MRDPTVMYPGTCGRCGVEVRDDEHDLDENGLCDDCRFDDTDWLDIAADIVGVAR